MERFYTTKEIAQALGLKTASITAAIRAGHLKAQKFGASYVITEESLAEYLNYRKGRKNDE